MLGDELARRIVELHVPPTPPTATELEQLAGLEHTVPLIVLPPEPRPPPEVPPADLRGDFQNCCRVTPRDDEGYGPIDLRPVCKLGPTFGYFRPRTWTSLSLTGASLLGTGILYGVGFGGASRWEPSSTERLQIGAHVMLASTVVLGTALAIVIASDRRQAKRFLDRLERQTEL